MSVSAPGGYCVLSVLHLIQKVTQTSSTWRLIIQLVDMEILG